MGTKSLVIVESPTKARTITKFLGSGYVVLASNGHVRDLPNNASEIPAALKKEAWARLGVNIENDFEPLYVIPARKKQHIADLKAALKNASEVYLATDEDREGESISWHLVETLKPKVPIKRLVFHEITKEAIAAALNSPREIDQNLVRAQETRRIVDRLFGYELSPLLWKKMAPGLSAGRVQSVAVRLLADRERERMRFRQAQYWGLKAQFQKPGEKGASFEAELTHVGEKRVALGKDFDPNTGKLSAKDNVVLLDKAAAETLKDKVLGVTASIKAVEEKPYTTRPAPPFVTSTLQQEGNRKLRFSAKHTMSVAQKLYENGFITYMRTDSTMLSDEALSGARSFIQKEYGSEYLPPQPRIYKTKVKNAQEAHEAIRPAGASFTQPDVVKQQLGDDAYRLYELIWMRTVASQMTDARGTYISVQIQADNAQFRASGKTIEFPGFLRAYVEGTDDPDAELADQEKVLPKVSSGDRVETNKVEANERTTQPSARYSEGSLIKELERLGIGRPSTWATVVELVLNREYAFKKGTALVPTFVAMALVNLLQTHFSQLLDFEFTARLEDDLDAISRGEAGNLSYLKTFYFGNGTMGLKSLVAAGEKDIDPRVVCGMALGTTEDGRNIEVRVGRYGPFISDGTNRASVPDQKAPDELTIQEAERILTDAATGPEPLGAHPETGEPVYLKSGRFGPYVQLGDMVEGGEKPKMASLLPGSIPADVTLELAVALLSLPRTVGKNPENQEDIVAANGRYGPYIKCGAETRSIPMDDYSPLTVTLEQAIALLKEPKRRGRTSAPKNLKELGNHPVSEKPLIIKSGRYGAYVTDGEINASLPKGVEAETLTIAQAVELLEARAARIESGIGVKKKRTSKKKAAPKEKKAAAKKPKKASKK